MTRHVAIFFACFLIGAVVTTVIRTSRHQPYASSAEPQPMDPAMSMPMSTGTPVMPAMSAPIKNSTPSAVPASPMPVASAASGPVNTICAICGMPVNSTLPTAIYQGKVIGFGCKTCPPKFAKEPEKYGPAALANRVVEE